MLLRYLYPLQRGLTVPQTTLLWPALLWPGLVDASAACCGCWRNAICKCFNSLRPGKGRGAEGCVCVCVCHVMDEALQQLCCCCSEIRKYLEELSKIKEEELHIWYVSCEAARQGEEIPWVSLNTLFVSLNNFRVFRRQNFIMSQYSLNFKFNFPL